MIEKEQRISTHTPLARRDRARKIAAELMKISTHTPLARRDVSHYISINKLNISTHTPLASRDKQRRCGAGSVKYFYSHASCEA